MKNDGKLPSILAIGDSWFWYPFPGGSLINYIGPVVEKKSHVILAKGMNGAEAFDYVDGKYAKSVREALRLYGAGLSAAFISGGGNDFAGFNDLRPLLKDDCSAESTAKGCFRPGDSGLKGFSDRMDEYYRKLIGVIYTRTSPSCHIIMHSYDYALPNGKAVFGDKGWLLPALVNAQVPAALLQPASPTDRQFLTLLTGIAEKADPQHLFVVDGQGTLAAKDWAMNCIPKAAASKLVRQRWAPLLKNVGLGQ